MKNEARQRGIPDTPEELFSYFVSKLGLNVHLVLCMSPVGETLRVRARKFPGLINQTMINWFHSWPKEALKSVAYSFLKDVEFPVEGVVEKIADTMSESHNTLYEINKKFLR